MEFPAWEIMVARLRPQMWVAVGVGLVPQVEPLALIPVGLVVLVLLIP